MGDRLYSVSKCTWKDKSLELYILITKGFLTPGVLADEFAIRIQLFLLERQNCAFSSSNFFGQKSVIELQVPTKCDRHWEN